MKFKKKNVLKMLIITISTFMLISIISPAVASASSKEALDEFDSIPMRN